MKSNRVKEGAAVQFLLEGQEEIGSPNLAELLQEHKDLLRADIALSADGGQISPKHVSPASLAAGLRETFHECMQPTCCPGHFMWSG